MVKPGGKKYSEVYSLSELKGHEILVLRTDDVYDKDAMVAVDQKIRGDNPHWSGTLLVLRTDQSIEKMPEPVAFALYQALKKCFEPNGADAPPEAPAATNTPAPEGTS